MVELASIFNSTHKNDRVLDGKRLQSGTWTIGNGVMRADRLAVRDPCSLIDNIDQRGPLHVDLPGLKLPDHRNCTVHGYRFPC